MIPHEPGQPQPAQPITAGAFDGQVGQACRKALLEGDGGSHDRTKHERAFESIGRWSPVTSLCPVHLLSHGMGQQPGPRITMRFRKHIDLMQQLLRKRDANADALSGRLEPHENTSGFRHLRINWNIIKRAGLRQHIATLKREGQMPIKRLFGICGSALGSGAGAGAARHVRKEDAEALGISFQDGGVISGHCYLNFMPD